MSAVPHPRPQGAPFRVMPGFGLSLGFTLFYLALIVLIPLSAVFLKTFTMTWEAFWNAVTSDRVIASYKLSFGASLIAASINAVFGGILIIIISIAPDGPLKPIGVWIRRLFRNRKRAELEHGAPGS